VLYSLAGWVVLHLMLTALGAAGIGWRPAAVLAAAVAAYWLGRRWLPGPEGRTRLPSDYGWGDGAALLALAAFTVSALSLWNANPDFVFHWGLKGERYFLAGGVDLAWLARGWNWVVHPDYPNLLPELYATSAMAAGRFSAPAMMLWSTICFALVLASLREALRRAGTGRWVAQATLALLGLALAAYGIGGLSAGGADWLIALALAAALPPLLDPATTRGAAQIGVIAAFAAGSKVEGLPLAAGLVVVYGLRLRAAERRARRLGGPAAAAAAGWTGNAGSTGGPGSAGSTFRPGDAGSPHAGRRGRSGLRSAAALSLPAAAVALPWLAQVWRYHLFPAFNSGPFLPARAPAVLAAVTAAALDPAWQGFGLGLALLPVLVLDRRLRPAAAVAALQLVFYLQVYFSVRIDPVALVMTSFARLVLHLLPVVLTGAAIAVERIWTKRGAAG
jgi:hypothetical protein